MIMDATNEEPTGHRKKESEMSLIDRVVLSLPPIVFGGLMGYLMGDGRGWLIDFLLPVGLMAASLAVLGLTIRHRGFLVKERE